MLSDYVGEDLFLKGVSLYLKKKLYANSVTNDLWEGIAAATGLSYLAKRLSFSNGSLSRR
jgi:aminopeptidase 2